MGNHTLLFSSRSLFKSSLIFFCAFAFCLSLLPDAEAQRRGGWGGYRSTPTYRPPLYRPTPKPLTPRPLAPRPLTPRPSPRLGPPPTVWPSPAIKPTDPVTGLKNYKGQVTTKGLPVVKYKDKNYQIPQRGVSKSLNAQRLANEKRIAEGKRWDEKRRQAAKNRLAALAAGTAVAAGASKASASDGGDDLAALAALKKGDGGGSGGGGKTGGTGGGGTGGNATGGSGTGGEKKGLKEAFNKGAVEPPHIKESRILRQAAETKGDFGLGSASREEADRLGKLWVGSGYRVASNGKFLVSADGLRQYRPPSNKPNSKKAWSGVQANFESRSTPSGEWPNNGHLDITDE